MDSLKDKTDHTLIISTFAAADGDLNKLKARLNDDLLKKYGYYFFHQVYAQAILHIHLKVILS